MKSTSQPVSKSRVFLAWAVLIGTIAGLAGFVLFHNQGQASPDWQGPTLFGSMLLCIIGGFFAVIGLAAYCLFVFTNAFTQDFSRPVWEAAKVRIFIANIFVPLATLVGLGLILSALTSPWLASFGISGSTARFLPIFLMIVVLQIVQVWVLIWSPLEKRLITKRLLARGLTLPQLETAFFIGLSNPASGMAKRFAAIEEDIGALWLAPEQMVYWGDSEEFAITRAQLVQLERRADARSTTMLSGVAHVILHVQLPDGRLRQIRLHNEGVPTMGHKRKAMNRLAEAIEAWHAGATQSTAA